MDPKLWKLWAPSFCIHIHMYILVLCRYSQAWISVFRIWRPSGPKNVDARGCLWKETRTERAAVLAGWIRSVAGKIFGTPGGSPTHGPAFYWCLLFFPSTFLWCVEPAAEGLLASVWSAALGCSRLISKLRLDNVVACQVERAEGGVWLAKIRYVHGKPAVSEGANPACWVGLAQLCYLHEMAVRAQPGLKPGLWVQYSSLMSQLLLWGLYGPCPWKVPWQSEWVCWSLPALGGCPACIWGWECAHSVPSSCLPSPRSAVVDRLAIGQGC